VPTRFVAGRPASPVRDFSEKPAGRGPRGKPVSAAPGSAAVASDHAALLRDSVAAFTGRGADVSRARALRGSAREYDREVWRRMGELGWLAILVPERCGGLGLGLAEAAIVAEGLARALAPEPYTAAAVLAVRALAAGDNEALQQSLLPALATGERVAVLAWQEAAGDPAGMALAATATPFEGGYRLNGTKRFVAGAAGADGYLVAAAAPQGIELYWVPADAPGVERRLEPLADGRHFGALALRDVAVPRERVAASATVARAALECAFDHAVAIAAAELRGVMNRALEMSLDYLRTRVQFGKPIGAFQALQHRAADLYVQQQLAAAVLDEALRALDAGAAPRARAMQASRAKARCADAASRITREAIQLHGAIGFTDEYDAGLYLKRALVVSAWLGGPTYHRRRYAALAAG
jgi:alkylation response protein AidB-like acyl-CoA dehydrogenase